MVSKYPIIYGIQLVNTYRTFFTCPQVLFFHFIFIQRSEYIRSKVTVHKCVDIIRIQVLFKVGPYKGQLILKFPFGVFKSTKKAMKFSAQACKRSNQKSGERDSK